MTKAKLKASKPLDDSSPDLPSGVSQNESENTVAKEARKPKELASGNWVEMTVAEVKSHQEAGNLKGYNPDKGLGLIT